MISYSSTSLSPGITTRLKSSSMAALFAVATLVAAVTPLFLYQSASAATTVVTPANTQGWSTADTRPGGAVNFIEDATSPAPKGALQLTTDATTTAKAQYLHDANTPIANVTEMSYYTKQVSGPVHADPSYQFIVDLNGAAAGGFTTFVYEPYQNPTQPIVPNTWQQWDVDQGQFWSSKTFTEGTCAVVNGAGGPPFYTLPQIKTMCPSAVAVGFGVNIGSNNPSYNVETDLVSFNGTAYNFEPTRTPRTKDDCKNGGYQNFNTPAFRNQGQCISYVEKHDTRIKGDIDYTAGSLKREAWFDMNTADNRGWFVYADANKDWYSVRVTEVNTDGNAAWFAGQVVRSKNNKFDGKWLFAKVEDNNPDKIWGDFVIDEATAENSVRTKQTPPSGPFNVTKGNLKIKKD